MKITKVRLGRISVPLRVPFKTALRRVDSVEDIIVEIHTDTGEVGFGEAPPTGAITGDTTGAIIGAFDEHIRKTLLGRDVDDFEDLTRDLQHCVVKNSSAKAAADIALWDLYGKKYGIPVPSKLVVVPELKTESKRGISVKVSFVSTFVQWSK